MKRTLALIGIAALLPLAACNKSAEPGANAGGANDAAGANGAETAQGAVAGSSGAPAGGIKITPGEWETVNEVVDLKIEGLPQGTPPGAMDQMRPPKTTVKSCVTPEDAENPNARMLAAQKDNRCTTSRMDMSGGRIDIAMACPAADGRGSATISMTGQYSATSYEMNGDMVMNGPNGMNMTLKSRTTGRRIGDCPA